MTEQKKLAVFDIDGTLFRWQLFYEVVLELRRTDMLNATDAAELDMTYKEWDSRHGSFGEFETSALAIWTRVLPDLDVGNFNEIVQSVLTKQSHRVYRYTSELASSLKADGYYLLAISGSQQQIAEPFAKQYGFDACIGWVYEQKDGAFTGETVRNTVHDKAQLLMEFAAEHGFDVNEAVAVGDSGGDISMLRAVGNPIAFNPSEELLDEATVQNWTIVVERKNIAYTLQKGTDATFTLAHTDRF